MVLPDTRGLVFIDISKSLLRRRIAPVVERRRLVCQSSEQPIEDEEPDPEVLVHQSVVVQDVMVDIVQSPRF